MSGFFDRLAAHAHKSEGAILPRVPSRFEPVAESAGAEAPIETIPQASTQPARAKDLPTPQPQPTVPRPETTNRAPSVVLDASTPAQRPRAKNHQATHEPPPPRIEATSRSLSFERASSKRDVEIPAAIAVSPVNEARAEAPATKDAQSKRRGREHAPESVVALQRKSPIEKHSETVRERIIERERRTSPIVSSAPQERAATTVQRRERVAKRDSVLARAPEVRTVVRVEAAAVPITPPVLPKLEPGPIAVNAPRFPAERGAPQAAPALAETVVHVSIGRIEVRAVTQAEERRQREPARSPVMSLGDYLNARSRQAR